MDCSNDSVLSWRACEAQAVQSDIEACSVEFDETYHWVVPDHLIASSPQRSSRQSQPHITGEDRWVLWGVSSCFLHDWCIIMYQSCKNMMTHLTNTNTHSTALSCNFTVRKCPLCGHISVSCMSARGDGACACYRPLLGVVPGSPNSPQPPISGDIDGISKHRLSTYNAYSLTW